MANHYSTYFNITHEDLVNRGVYNAFLDKDSLKIEIITIH